MIKILRHQRQRVGWDLPLSFEHCVVARLVLERQAKSTARVRDADSYNWRDLIVVAVIELRDKGCAEEKACCLFGRWSRIG